MSRAASGAHPDRTAAAFGLPPRVACPFCGGEDTELHSPFGSALSVATYWCRRCHAPFERFKRDAPRQSGG